MGRKIGGVCLALVGIFLLFLSIKGFIQLPKSGDELKDAVFVTDGKLDPANEGKTVVVQVDLSKASGAVDDELGLSFSYPRVVRHVEKLEKQSYGTLKWVTQEDDTEFPNKKDFFGKLEGTEYEIDAGLLMGVGDLTDLKEEDLDAKELKRFLDHNDAWSAVEYKQKLYITDTDSSCFEDFVVKSSEESPENRDAEGVTENDYQRYKKQKKAVGSYRIHYMGLKTDKLKNVAVIGKQQGNALVKDERVGGMSAYENVTSLDDIIESNKKWGLIGLIVFAILGLGLVAGGARLFLVET